MDAGKPNPKLEIYASLCKNKLLGSVSHTTGMRPRADLMSNTCIQHDNCRMFQWDVSHCPLQTKPVAEFCHVLHKVVPAFTDLLCFKCHGMNAIPELCSSSSIF